MRSRTVAERVFDSLLVSVTALLLLQSLSPGTVEVPVSNVQPVEESPVQFPFA